MNEYKRKNNDGNIAFGFIILGIGIILFLRKAGVFIPSWVTTWPMILIAIGTFSVIKHEFKSFFGFVMLFLGAYFLLRNEFDFDFGLGQYIWPLGLIALGIYLILQKQRENKVLDDVRRDWEKKRKTDAGYSKSYVEEAKIVDENSGNSTGSGSSSFAQGAQSATGSGFTRTTGTAFADRLNIDAIFSGVNRKLMTKDFQGGKITAAFGGVDLDLTSADFNGVITIQIDIIFGGVKMIVPPHWDIRTEVTNIAAGIEDKRYFREGGVDPNKVVILKGTILFGGLEIKSF
jgi:predicted membrane protein